MGIIAEIMESYDHALQVCEGNAIHQDISLQLFEKIFRSPYGSDVLQYTYCTQNTLVPPRCQFKGADTPHTPTQNDILLAMHMVYVVLLLVQLFRNADEQNTQRGLHRPILLEKGQVVTE